jgi:hypothetical protein
MQYPRSKGDVQHPVPVHMIPILVTGARELLVPAVAGRSGDCPLVVLGLLHQGFHANGGK